MKVEITRNQLAIERQEGRVWFCGYCVMQALERLEPEYYNAATFGWNWDAYVLRSGLRNLYVLTGFRNLVGREIPAAVVDAIDAKAAKAASPEEIEAIIYDALAALN